MEVSVVNGISRHIVIVMAGAAFFWWSPPEGIGATEIGFAPTANLESVDIALLDRAQKSVDIAMYAFTDRKISKELISLARRGVRIRLYRDFWQTKDRNDQTRTLAGRRGIEIRIKNTRRSFDIMHIKAFAVDGRILREGSANWSGSGEGAACHREYCEWNDQQDNTVTVSENPELARKFEERFERMWSRSGNIRIEAR